MNDRTVTPEDEAIRHALRVGATYLAYTLFRTSRGLSSKEAAKPWAAFKKSAAEDGPL